MVKDGRQASGDMYTTVAVEGVEVTNLFLDGKNRSMRRIETTIERVDCIVVGSSWGPLLTLRSSSLKALPSGSSSAAHSPPVSYNIYKPLRRTSHALLHNPPKAFSSSPRSPSPTQQPF